MMVNGKPQNFVHVTNGKGKEGWVSADYLDKTTKHPAVQQISMGQNWNNEVPSDRKEATAKDPVKFGDFGVQAVQGSFENGGRSERKPIGKNHSDYEVKTTHGAVTFVGGDGKQISYPDDNGKVRHFRVFGGNLQIFDEGSDKWKKVWS